MTETMNKKDNRTAETSLSKAFLVWILGLVTVFGFILMAESRAEAASTHSTSARIDHATKAPIVQIMKPDAHHPALAFNTASRVHQTTHYLTRKPQKLSKPKTPKTDRNMKLGFAIALFLGMVGILFTMWRSAARDIRQQEQN